MKVSSIKNTCIAILLAAAVLPASAIEFGGTLGDTTKFTGAAIKDLSLDQTNTLTTWVRAPFNNAGTVYLAAEGLFKYEYIQTTNSYLLTADVDLFKFGSTSKFKGNKTLTISAGRFYESDATNVILAQTCDGALVQFKMKRLNLSAFGGYTGLLNAKQITILNSASSSYSYNTTSMYAFAAPYAICAAGISAPYLFANQSIGLQFFSFFGTASTTSGYNRLYGTLTLNGPLASNIFYTMTETIGSSTIASLSNLSQLQISYYPNFKSASINVTGIYASGNNGPFKTFTGFTSNTATLAIDSPEYTGLIKAGLSASIKPISQLYIAAGCDCIFACPESTVSYDGFQFYGNTLYQLFTDVQLGLSGQQYFDVNKETDKTCFTVKAVISF